MTKKIVTDKNGWIHITTMSDSTGTALWLFPENAGHIMWNDGARAIRKLKDFHGYQPSRASTEKNLIKQEEHDGGVRRPTRIECSQISMFLDYYPAVRKDLLKKFEQEAWIQTMSTHEAAKNYAWFSRIRDGLQGIQHQYSSGKNYLLLVRTEPHAQPK